MPKFLKIATLICLVLPLQSADPTLDTAPLKAWLEQQKNVKTLHAEFTQERTLPALKKPITTPGTLHLHHDGRMRWNLGDPTQTIAISDGENVQLIDLKKQRQRSISADSPQARPFTLLSSDAFSSGLEGFLKQFKLIESRTTNGIYQLTTQPQDAALRRHIPWVFFDIDLNDHSLRALEIQLKDKSRIRTIFTKVTLNSQIPDHIFLYDPEN